MIFRTLLRRLYIQPAGYPAHYQSRRERFSTLPPSSMYHVFLSINAPPPGTDSWHVWRDTSRLMIFLFPSNTRSLFPLILLLSLSLSLFVHLHILSTSFRKSLEAFDWKQTESIASNGFFSLRRKAWNSSLCLAISFKIYFYTSPGFNLRMILMDRLEIGWNKEAVGNLVSYWRDIRFGKLFYFVRGGRNCLSNCAFVWVYHCILKSIFVNDFIIIDVRK